MTSLATRFTAFLVRVRGVAQPAASVPTLLLNGRRCGIGLAGGLCASESQRLTRCVSLRHSPSHIARAVELGPLAGRASCTSSARCPPPPSPLNRRCFGSGKGCTRLLPFIGPEGPGRFMGRLGPGRLGELPIHPLPPVLLHCPFHRCSALPIRPGSLSGRIPTEARCLHSAVVPPVIFGKTRAPLPSCSGFARAFPPVRLLD